MKAIEKEITIYKNIYVSVDGKEFDKEDDCKEWEESYKGTLSASWKLIKKIEASAYKLGLAGGSEDDECYIIKPSNLEEIALINAYIHSSTYCSGTTLTAQHIGKLVALDFGYDHEYCSAHIIDDHLKMITDYIASIATEMSENA